MLLTNGGLQLVGALEEVIQLAWTSETLPESCTKGVLCPKNSDNLTKQGDQSNLLRRIS
jgi:hypothetical protein